MTRAESGGATRILIASPCRAGEAFVVEHVGLEFGGRFDAEGRAGLSLPILDRKDGAVRQPQTRAVVEPALVYRARDLDRIHRVAVAWTAAVDLDLHAFEYASGFNGDGHVWAHHPRAFADVRRAGGGFLQSHAAVAEGGQSVEVYTFWASLRTRPGHMRIALDHASRGDLPAGEYCGAGALAAPDYTVVRSEFGRIADRSVGRFAPAACGETLSADARYAGAALGDLRIAR